MRCTHLARSQGSAFVDQLEQRRLLSVNIPVLIFHQPTVAAWTPFTAVIDAMNANSFQTISLQQYYDYNQLPNHPLPAGVTRPFIAMFDDGYYETLAASEYMKRWQFKGVVNVITKRADAATAPLPEETEANRGVGGGDTETGETGTGTDTDTGVGAETVTGAGGDDHPENLSWDQIRHLVFDDGWEVASHSVSHQLMGALDADRTTDQYRNSPQEIENEGLNSRKAIQKNVFHDANGDRKKNPDEIASSVTPIAFVHPYDDVTAVSLEILSGYYPMVFAKSFDVTDFAFIGDTTNLTNGQLVRIGITPSTTASNIDDLCSRAVNHPFAPKIIADYTTVYRDDKGDIVAHGQVDSGMNPLNDLIVVADDKVYINQVGHDRAELINTPKYKVTSTLPDPGFKNVVAYGGNGNDTLRVDEPLSTQVSSIAMTLAAGSGNDSVTGSNANEWIKGSSGNDWMNANGGDDRVYGGSGDDTIYGGSGADHLYGDTGNDTMYDAINRSSDNDPDYMDGGTDVGGGDHDRAVRFDPPNTDELHNFEDFGDQHTNEWPTEETVNDSLGDDGDDDMGVLPIT